MVVFMQNNDKTMKKIKLCCYCLWEIMAKYQSTGKGTINKYDASCHKMALV